MIRRLVLCALVVMALARPASAQSLGTFRFQLQPHCNVVTVVIVQQGSQYQFDGTDDQCAAGPRAGVTGMAFLNPDGSLGFGFSIITAPGGAPVHVDATMNLTTLAGTWRDSAGNTGPFVYTPGPSTGGSPRATPVVGDISAITAGSGLSGGGASGAVALAVDFAATQQRVAGTCPSGQLMTAVQQDGQVVCQSVTGAGDGDITSVISGPGLIGGAATGDVVLSVAFGASGFSNTAARSDHFHGVQGVNNIAIGLGALAINGATSNVAIGVNTLRLNVNGSTNAAVGAGALELGSSGTANTALGYLTLRSTTASANTAVGAYAARFNTSGAYNVAVGYSALGATTTANYNTAVGAFAMQANTTGTDNVGVGPFALASNTTGNQSTAVGSGALVSAATSIGNTAVGYLALNANTTGASNAALGGRALQATTTGSANTAIGSEALQNNTTGRFNTAVGSNTLGASTGGSENVAAGSNALGSSLTGQRNTAIGFSALASSTTNDNTAVGWRALDLATFGGQNTAFGVNALGSTTSGGNNVAIGSYALESIVSGSNNIALGHGAGANSTGDNNLYLAASGNNGESNVIRIGNGAQTATYIDGISGATSASGVLVFVNASGKLGTLNSSARFKQQVEPLGGSFSARVQALRPVSFVYKPEFDDGSKQVQYGLIAEEVAETFPELAVRNADGSLQTVRYQFLAPLLLAEVQRLERERAAAETARAALEDRVRRLESTLVTWADGLARK